MGRTATRPAPTTMADPLADLRPSDDSPAGQTPQTEDAAVQAIRPTAPQSFHDEARAEIVAAFHGDTVATGMLHKGGTCGCRYLATLALRTAPGAPQEPEVEQEEQGEPDGD
jgi:hypothetical protein